MKTADFLLMICLLFVISACSDESESLENATSVENNSEYTYSSGEIEVRSLLNEELKIDDNSSVKGMDLIYESMIDDKCQCS